MAPTIVLFVGSMSFGLTSNIERSIDRCSYEYMYIHDVVLPGIYTVAHVRVYGKVDLQTPRWLRQAQRIEEKRKQACVEDCRGPIITNVEHLWFL